MRDRADRPKDRPRWVAWGKFAAGVLVLLGVVLVLMQGYTPPGAAGEVFRNNQRNGIDATPLFYTDLESLAPDE